MIIARVQTWDHKQPDKAFYSYYHAHHLNRLLFQTQVYLEKKLIHRLHVLNPLTNTDIIGHVLYFMVIAKTRKKPNTDSPYTLSTPEYRITVPTSPSVQKLPPIADIVQLNISLHNQNGSPSAKSGNKDDFQKTWTLAGPVAEQVEPEEYEMLSTPVGDDKNVRPFEFPKRKSVAARKFVNTDLEANRDSLNSVENLLDKKDKKADNQAPLASPRKPGLQIITKFKSDDDNTAPVSAVVKPTASSPLSLKFPLSAYPGSSGNQKGSWSKQAKAVSFVPRGVVSQKGEVVKESNYDQVVTDKSKGRRRQMSYMNSIQNEGGLKSTVDEWEEGLAEEKEDSDIPIAQNPKKPKELNLLALKPKEQEELVYDAILIANDSDFLETSKTRQIFRENAINPSDAVLFEMPAYTGEEPQLRGRSTGDDLICDMCIPTSHQLNHPDPWVRYYHRYKCYVVILVLTGSVLGFIWYIALNQPGASRRD